MSPAAISDETKVLLSRISTATLTSQLLARGLRNTFMQNVYRLTTGGGSMVGEAFTLRYIPSREDLDVSTVFESREHPQRKAVETIPQGHVLVMDCRQDKRAASGRQHSHHPDDGAGCRRGGDRWRLARHAGYRAA